MASVGEFQARAVLSLYFFLLVAQEFHLLTGCQYDTNDIMYQTETIIKPQVADYIDNDTDSWLWVNSK